MANIKPAEVSQILKQQLEGFKSEVELEEVGTVLQVGDGIARIYGLSNVEANEMIEFDSGVKGIILNLEEDNVGAVLLGLSSLIKEGDTVKRLNRIASIMVGEQLLGRVINTIGEPIDGKGAIQGELLEMPLERKAPGVIFRQPVKQPLQTGLKAIDAMIPIGRGQRELIIGDRQTGKTAVAIDTIINQRENFEKGHTGILYLCSHWTKRFYSCQHCSNTRKTWCHGLYGNCYLQRLLILLHCSFMHLMQELPLESISAILVVML